MAPIKKRVSARAKSVRGSLPRHSNLPQPDQESPFPPSKKDKQKIKHSSFVSKIEKSSSKALKRRRPNKKLVATLESLADALSGLEGETDGTLTVGQTDIRRKSLKSMKSRPGAMKRKEKLEKLERDRFNKNMAQLANNTSENTMQDRWAALKSHVQSTMEVKSEFVRKEDI